jgi:hypothetical protein
MSLQLDPNPKEPKKLMRIHADLNQDLKPGFVIFIDLPVLIMKLVIILAALDFLEIEYLLRRVNNTIRHIHHIHYRSVGALK